MVRAGNREAIRRVTGCDPEKFIREYIFWLDGRPRERFQAEEAVRLRIRMKSEMKEAAAEGKKRPWKLYIADCLFYHNRICSEMDYRGFSGYGHMHDTNDERLVHRFIRGTAAARVTLRGATEPEAIPCNMVNCFCMFSGYQPLTPDEWIETDRERMAALDAELGLKI